MGGSECLLGDRDGMLRSILAVIWSPQPCRAAVEDVLEGRWVGGGVACG